MRIACVKKRILIADYLAHSRELIRIILESEGYEVVEARDGAEAIAKTREHLPDLILLDLQMPIVDGFNVISILRSDRQFARIPVVALTASAMHGDRERAIEAGFTKYIAKPVPIAVLRAEVANLLQIAAAHDG